MKTSNYYEIENEDTKVCVMRGFYNENGEYCEEYMEGIGLYNLPEKAAVRVDLWYDITTLYSNRDVLVVARRRQDIEEYKELEAKPRFFHGLLHQMENSYYDGYMCILTNLKAIRNRRKKKMDNNAVN